MTAPRYRRNERVWEHERIHGLCKVIGVEWDVRDRAFHYLVREFAHPHRIERVDEQHLSRPVGPHHDARRTG